LSPINRFTAPLGYHRGPYAFRTMTVPAMNPFAMLLDSTAAIQAHENVLNSLRKEVHKRADALPRHLQPEVVEFDTAIEAAATSGKAGAGVRVDAKAKVAGAPMARKKPAARVAEAN
jgi:hypothetical protein